LQTAWREWVNRQAVFSQLLTLTAQLPGREIVLEERLLSQKYSGN